MVGLPPPDQAPPTFVPQLSRVRGRQRKLDQTCVCIDIMSNISLASMVFGVSVFLVEVILAMHYKVEWFVKCHEEASRSQLTEPPRHSAHRLRLEGPEAVVLVGFVFSRRVPARQ